MKIALAGIGKIARDQHMPAIAASPDWELAAAVSRNQTVDGVPNYSDFAEMLEAHPEIETVSLCMPPVPRFDYAVAALHAGRHVMLEKPPGATITEVQTLQKVAAHHGKTLYASWHSRSARFVQAAKAWMVGKRVERFTVTWHEDVRKWHPGQDWVFEPGGMGVFDPGINALSIVTEILPFAIHLRGAVLDFPENRATPIAAELDFVHPHRCPCTASLNWDHTGEELWQIEAVTDQGTLTLKNGGDVMEIDGQPSSDDDGSAGEYPSLYAHMAELVRDRRSDVDLSPMIHLADAMTLGERRIVKPFNW